MADLPRGPLEVNRREIPPIFGVSLPVFGRLLTLTLATAIPLPLGAAHALPAQVLTPPARLVQNADTSYGTPKTLTADGQPPIIECPHFAQTVAQQRLGLDTSQGMSPVLKAILPPFVNPPVFAQDRARPVTDTSRGTPKALIADAQTPCDNLYLQAPEPVRTVVDTSRGQPITLQVIIPPPPFVVPVGFAPLKFWWQPQDSSASSAKVLTADLQLPVQNYQHTAPDRIRPVADTSQSTQLGLFPVPLPPGAAAWVGLPRFWFQPSDTSQSSAKVLYGDLIPPFVNLPYPVPDLIRPVVDTSQSSYGTSNQVVVIPLPPGNALYVAPSQWAWSISDTTQESPPVAIQNVQPGPPAPPTPVVGGGGHRTSMFDPYLKSLLQRNLTKLEAQRKREKEEEKRLEEERRRIELSLAKAKIASDSKANAAKVAKIYGTLTRASAKLAAARAAAEQTRRDIAAARDADDDEVLHALLTFIEEDDDDS